MSESDDWQVVDSSQNRIVRFKIEPGFVSIQTIQLDGQNLAEINTIKLRNEIWIGLAKNRSIQKEPQPAPWIQNPDRNKEKPF